MKQVSLLCGIQCLLGEAEKFILISFNKLTPEELSEYSLVQNLCGLIPRVIYSPIEESAYTYFGKFETNKSYTKVMEFTPDLQAMCNVISFLSCIGLFAVFYSYNFSFSALNLLYSTNWSNPVFLHIQLQSEKDYCKINV